MDRDRVLALLSELKKLLKEADDAIYERRLASIDQEKRVKESELETEVAMQRKEQEIQEIKHSVIQLYE